MIIYLFLALQIILLCMEYYTFFNRGRLFIFRFGIEDYAFLAWKILNFFLSQCLRSFCVHSLHAKMVPMSGLYHYVFCTVHSSESTAQKSGGKVLKKHETWKQTLVPVLAIIVICVTPIKIKQWPLWLLFFPEDSVSFLWPLFNTWFNKLMKIL